MPAVQAGLPYGLAPGGDRRGGTISAFRVGPFGLLQAIPCGKRCSLGPSPYAGSQVDPTQLVVDPSGRFLFVAAYLSPVPHAPGGVVAFRIAANGSLTRVPCPGSCFTTGMLSGLAVGPDGKFLYATKQFGIDGFRGSLAVWRIGQGGLLTPVDCDEFGQCHTGDLPRAPVIDPTGNYLYLTSGFPPEMLPETLEVFSLGSDGTPTKIPCTASAGCEPQEGAFEGDLALNPSGTVLYAIDDQISAFNVDGSSLSPIPCAGDCSTGGAYALAIEPRGRFIYAVDPWGNRLLAYAIGSDGSVQSIGCASAAECATGQSPGDLVVLEPHAILRLRR